MRNEILFITDHVEEVRQQLAEKNITNIDVHPDDSNSDLYSVIKYGVIPNKKSAKIIDFTSNISRLYKEGDLYHPIVEEKTSKRAPIIHIKCKGCDKQTKVSFNNEFKDFPYNDFGEVVDLSGRITGDCCHFSHRCKSCGYLFNPKPCKRCGVDNVKTARRCEACGYKIIDENLKISFDFKVDVKTIKVDYHKQVLKVLVNNRMVFYVGFTNYKIFHDKWHRPSIIDCIRRCDVLYYNKTKSGFLEILEWQ